MPATPPPAATLDADIFLRLWDGPQLTRPLARHLLKLSFAAADEERMRELADKNREGQITPAELDQLDQYVRVGTVLSILQSRARKLLRARVRSKNGRR
jgi:hypothetical protein